MVPSLLHQLVLGDVSKKTLRNLDITIQRSIHAWLHLTPLLITRSSSRIMTKGNVTWVLHPIISADIADLKRQKADKMLTYHTPEVQRFIHEGKDTDHLICIDGLVFTNRGTICKRSMRVLRPVIPRTYLNYIVLRILQLTWRTINTYQSRAV